jgi:hypothetical protein
MMGNKMSSKKSDPLQLKDNEKKEELTTKRHEKPIHDQPILDVEKLRYAAYARAMELGHCW